MLKEALAYIVGLSTPTIQSVDGIPYSDRRLTPVKPDDIEALHVHTLTGVVDLISHKFEDIDEKAEAAFVHVVDFDKVQVIAKKSDRYRVREQLIVAESSSSLSFSFGVFMDPEQFVIGIQSHMVPLDGTDFARVLQIVGTLSSEGAVQTSDDGFTQQVSTRAGVVLKNSPASVNPRVTLAPYRTFREVEQPASQFLLRFRTNAAAGAKPSVALFEADGGQWKLEAIGRIADWLRTKTELEVIA